MLTAAVAHIAMARFSVPNLRYPSDQAAANRRQPKAEEQHEAAKGVAGGEKHNNVLSTSTQNGINVVVDSNADDH